jgi:hypothetical protein
VEDYRTAPAEPDMKNLLSFGERWARCEPGHRR